MDGLTYTRLNEGRRLTSYQDQNGIWTVGDGCTGDDPYCSPDPVIGPNTVWTEAQCDEQSGLRYARAENQASYDIGISCWATIDVVRRAAIADIAYQDGGGNAITGVGGLAGYHQMLAAIRGKMWATAQAQCIDSLNEVQTPDRCNRNADMLLTGMWQAGYGG